MYGPQYAPGSGAGKAGQFGFDTYVAAAPATADESRNKREISAMLGDD